MKIRYYFYINFIASLLCSCSFSTNTILRKETYLVELDIENNSSNLLYWNNEKGEYVNLHLRKEKVFPGDKIEISSFLGIRTNFNIDYANFITVCKEVPPGKKTDDFDLYTDCDYLAQIKRGGKCEYVVNEDGSISELSSFDNNAELYMFYREEENVYNNYNSSSYSITPYAIYSYKCRELSFNKNSNKNNL